jgi:hypothetical protein
MNQLDTGYQKITFQYDSSGRTVGDLFYDSDGKPAVDKTSVGSANSAGCYGWLFGYDQSFNRTVSVCLDANGKALNALALHNLAVISLGVTFDFARAFELDQQLVAQNPTPAYRLDLEEAALTDDQFDVCQTQAASIKDSDLSPPQLIVRDALLLACQYASGQKSDARATAASLSGRVIQMTAGEWDFGGTRHYIQASSRFQAGSDAWDNLFLSLQMGDGQGAIDALNQLQPVLKD